MNIHFRLRHYLFFFACCVLFIYVCSARDAAAKLQDASSHRTRIIMFYVDGLRPDNVDEAVAAHDLPNIEKLFYQEGLRFQNAFTIFPSNTVVSNSLFMTGKWPENSGLKSQAVFERFLVPGQSHLEHFIDRIGESQSYPRYFNLLTKTDVGPLILKKNKIRTLYDYLGERFHGSVLPINPYSSPIAWAHAAVNVVPHFYRVALEAPDEIDRINGEYAMRYMLMDERADLFLIWFPGVDEAQHLTRDGQFGKDGSERLKEVDAYIGKIYQGIKNGMENPDDKLIAVLFSDHGAVGGKDGNFNQPFHIARDYFYQELKMNVRGPDFSITHPGTDPQSYAFVDNMGRAQASFYLPHRDSTSGDWSKRNSLYDLQHYGLGPNRPQINLIKEVSEIDLSARNILPGKTDPHPVEMLMVKISETAFYIRRFDGAQALILVKGVDNYRYVPVDFVEQEQNGKTNYRQTAQRDPFDYLKDLNFASSAERQEFLKKYHNKQQWLLASYKTQYPDAVVNIVKSFRWNSRLKTSADSRDPDFYISAAPGWNFRIEDIECADHGSLRADSTRITLMMSGPGIKRGVIQKPHHMIELTPTLFKLLGYSKPTDFDEMPLSDIYD